MGFFSFNKPKHVEQSIAPLEQKNDYQSFSTPFRKIGKGNLGSPYVNPYYTVAGIVQFGSDNLYPQLLDQMYYTSAIHGACIDFITNTTIGGGFDYNIPILTGKEKVDIFTFERLNKIKKLIKSITRDKIIHKRVCVLVYKDDKGNFKRFKRFNPATIRNNRELDKFIYCNDWNNRTGMKEYKRYNSESKEQESLYIYQEETVGQDVYPFPTYISVMNDIYLDGEIAFLQKSNIQNSIWPSLAVRVPHTFKSQDEVDAFKKGLGDKTGAEEAGRIMVVVGNGMDDTPEIVPISSNANDKLFNDTIDGIMNKVCIAHNINPSIMGIKVAGSLGNAQELQMSYSIFEKNVIMPLRDEISEIMDELFDIAGIKNTIHIRDFRIIDSQVAEVPSVEESITGLVNKITDKKI